ncbi:MAG: AAA family ATPase [Gemmatimonadota bacterium]
MSAPFRIGGVVSGEYFTGRAAEIRRIAGALREPQAALLVYGARRMGKTSALEAAAARVRRKGGAVIVADLSTGSTVGDVANRILLAATRELGRVWKDVVGDFARRITPAVLVTMDPATGQPVLSLEAGARAKPIDEQRQTLAQVLDAVAALAASRQRVVGVILDEFQELHQFGGEEAEWHLRATMQKHKNIGYVLAGSRETLIQQMLGKDRAFYKQLELLHFGPIDPGHLARWIDERLAAAGVRASGIGRRAIELGGARTRDVLQLARAAYYTALERGQPDVDVAFVQVVREEEDAIRAQWDQLTALQQNVLRAVATEPAQLYAEETRRFFNLGPTASVAGAVDALMDKALLVKQGDRLIFESPFTRGWVILNALPDIGLLKEHPF